MKKIIVQSKKELTQVIQEQTKHHGDFVDLNFIDTSRITDMSHLFAESKYNGDISQWDVSNVRDMSWMFYQSHFNFNLSTWNVGNVRTMRGMFYQSDFNGDISKWNVQNVDTMELMFHLSNFQGDIHLWTPRLKEDTDPDTAFISLYQDSDEASHLSFTAYRALCQRNLLQEQFNTGSEQPLLKAL